LLKKRKFRRRNQGAALEAWRAQRLIFPTMEVALQALSWIENKGAEYVGCGAQKLVPSHYTAAVKSTRPASFVAVETCMVFRADIPDNAEEFQKVVKLLAGPEDY